MYLGSTWESGRGILLLGLPEYIPREFSFLHGLRSPPSTGVGLLLHKRLNCVYDLLAEGGSFRPDDYSNKESWTFDLKYKLIYFGS